MDNPQLFQIGDVAKLFHLSVSSLRHYENLGLLTPEYIAPDTGYRYYSPRQFEALNTIRYLRALDMPLAEIADFLQNKDVDKIEEKLRHQKAVVMEKQRELQRIERKIDNRLRQLHDAQHSQLDVVRLTQCPPCRMVWMADSLHLKNFFDMELPIRRLEQSQAETAIFLGKVGVGISPEHLRAGRFEQYDGIFLLLDDVDEFQGEILHRPETTCVSIRFRGSHPEAPEQYRKLLDYLQTHHLAVADFSQEVTMIDYGITKDTEKFVTEIRIPVRPNPEGCLR